MSAGPVFRLLIGARRGIVPPHVTDVRVAAPAKGRYQFAGANAAKRRIVAMILELVEGRAAAVAVVAEQSLLPMEIVCQSVFVGDRRPFGPQVPTFLVAQRARVTLREHGRASVRLLAVACWRAPDAFGNCQSDHKDHALSREVSHPRVSLQV